MNNDANKAVDAATITTTQAASPFGSREPRVEVRMRKDATHRELQAVLHLIAAEIAMTTPATEKWSIRIEQVADDRGRVCIALLDGTQAEADRAMEVLRRVVS
jgi:hypothetical protein